MLVTIDEVRRASHRLFERVKLAVDLFAKLAGIQSSGERATGQKTARR